MLLTSSSISVAISSSIVFVFTSLLFLSGYVLQQQTIRSLQSTIRPHRLSATANDAITPLPASKDVPSTSPVLAKHFGRPPGHSFYDKFLASNRPHGGWAKAAYVALLREEVQVCNAVMIFKELVEGESMAQRILMYPSEWDDDYDESGNSAQGRLDDRIQNKEQSAIKVEQKREESQKSSKRTRNITKRLLRLAAKEYKVMLQPIRPVSVAQTDDNKWRPEEKYPLTNLLTLHTFNRIIYLPSPSGLLMDPSPFDLLFTLPMDGHESGGRGANHRLGEENTGRKLGMLGLSDPLNEDAEAAGIILIEPSKQLYTDTVAALPEGAYGDDEFLALVKTVQAPLSSSKSNTVPSKKSAAGETEGDSARSSLIMETSSFQNLRGSFNATGFLEGDTTAYIWFKDGNLPGPEYDISHSRSHSSSSSASPSNKRRAVTGTSKQNKRKKSNPDQAKTAEAVRHARREIYARYRDQRMDVCGLDLEVWDVDAAALAITTDNSNDTSDPTPKESESESEGNEHEMTHNENHNPNSQISETSSVRDGEEKAQVRKQDDEQGKTNEEGTEEAEEEGIDLK